MGSSPSKRMKMHECDKSFYQMHKCKRIVENRTQCALLVNAVWVTYSAHTES